MFVAKIMQMSGMQACLYIPKCRLSYAKIRISGDKHVVVGTNMQKSAPRLAARLFAPCVLPVCVK